MAFFSNAKSAFFGGWVECLRPVYNVPFDFIIQVLVLQVQMCDEKVVECSEFLFLKLCLCP